MAGENPNYLDGYKDKKIDNKDIVNTGAKIRKRLKEIEDDFLAFKTLMDASRNPEAKEQSALIDAKIQEYEIAKNAEKETFLQGLRGEIDSLQDVVLGSNVLKDINDVAGLYAKEFIEGEDGVLNLMSKIVSKGREQGIIQPSFLFDASALQAGIEGKGRSYSAILNKALSVLGTEGIMNLKGLKPAQKQDFEELQTMCQNCTDTPGPETFKALLQFQLYSDNYDQYKGDKKIYKDQYDIDFVAGKITRKSLKEYFGQVWDNMNQVKQTPEEPVVVPVEPEKPIEEPVIVPEPEKPIEEPVVTPVEPKKPIEKPPVVDIVPGTPNEFLIEQLKLNEKEVEKFEMGAKLAYNILYNKYLQQNPGELNKKEEKSLEFYIRTLNSHKGKLNKDIGGTTLYDQLKDQGFLVRCQQEKEDADDIVLKIVKELNTSMKAQRTETDGKNFYKFRYKGYKLDYDAKESKDL